MTTERDEAFEVKSADINELYHQAQELAQQGERVISNDELSEVQALERRHPGLPLRPGKVERREYEYIRHGMLTFIINFEVATGQIGLTSAGPTRTEQDYLTHIQRTVAAEPMVTRWHFVVDQLNIHQSASLVRYVAAQSDIAESEANWGSKAKAVSSNP